MCLMRPCTPVKGGGGGGVFPTGIDRCLFVFAMGPDFINPARITIIPPPCQRERERGHRGREAEEEVLTVGTRRKIGVGGRVVKQAFYSF